MATNLDYRDTSERYETVKIPFWYEELKQVIERLRKEQGSSPTRERAVVITMLEQALAYAWLFVVSR